MMPALLICIQLVCHILEHNAKQQTASCLNFTLDAGSKSVIRSCACWQVTSDRCAGYLVDSVPMLQASCHQEMLVHYPQRASHWTDPPGQGGEFEC